MSDSLLTPGVAGRESTVPPNEYPLGYRPGFWIYADDTLVASKAIGGVGYDAAVSRVQVSLGIDQVNTLSITFTGEQAALLVRDKFPKRMNLRLEVGYDDQPGSRQTIFAGHALQAFPVGVNPVDVELESDSLMYQAREDRTAAAGTEDQTADYIKSRLHLQPTPLTANLEGEAPSADETQLDVGGANDGNLLDYIQKWTKDQFAHWIDRMNGEIKFFYPGAKVDLFRPWRTWHLSGRRVQSADKAPAILKEWSPRQSFVDSPSLITASWYQEDDPTIEPQIVEATNTNGLEDMTLHLGPLFVKTREAAQAIVDAAAQNYYWAVIEGGFALSVGVPIVPLDDIVPLNPPPGLEEYYDRAFEVIKVTHTIDAAGWKVSGDIRGGRGA